MTRVESDSQAEVYVLFIARVGVEVVGGAAIELVALAEFASDEQAESYRSEAGGDPAHGLDEGRLFFLRFGSRLLGEGKCAGGGDVLRPGVIGATWRTEHYHLDDSSGVPQIAELGLLLRSLFCVIGLLTLRVKKGCNYAFPLDRCKMRLDVSQILGHLTQPAHRIGDPPYEKFTPPGVRHPHKREPLLSKLSSV